MLLGQAVALASDVPFSPSVITVIYDALVDVYDNLLLQHEWEKRQRPLLSQQPILWAIVRHTQWSNLGEGHSGFLLHNIKESPIRHFLTVIIHYLILNLLYRHYIFLVLEQILNGHYNHLYLVILILLLLQQFRENVRLLFNLLHFRSQGSR